MCLWSMKVMEVVNLAPENVEFHAIIERIVDKLEYGQVTVNIQLQNGKPVLETLSVVSSKRKKYQLDKTC